MSEAETNKGPVVLTDAKGRKLTLREPVDILTETRLIRALGADAQNTAFMYGYVMPATAVGLIDGEPVEFPLTPLKVNALIQRLGREGINAVLIHQSKQMQDAAEGEVGKEIAAAAAAAEETVRVALKN